MRSFFMIGFYFIEVMVKFPCYFLWILLELSHNKHQNKKLSFPGLFPILFSYVDPYNVHIVGTLKFSLCWLSKQLG